MNKYENISKLMFAHLQPYNGKARTLKTVHYRQTVPAPSLPDGFNDSRLYLRRLVYQAAEKQFGKATPPEVRYRIEQELTLLTIKEGWVDYFILVRNAIKQSRTTIEGCLPVSRGKVACSMVCHLLELTFANPLQFNLPFESFFHLKTNRIPDLTIESDSLNHVNFVDMLKQQYGNKMASTFQSVKRKDGKTKESISDFRWVLSREDLSDIMPMREIRDSKTGNQTLCPDFMNCSDIQEHGGTFLHILTMPSISIVSKILDLIGISNEEKFDFLQSIPLDDSDTWKTIQNGDFQDISWLNNWYKHKLEYIQDVQLDSLEKLVTFNTLFRPFLDVNISEYILRTKSNSMIDYPISEMSDILDETKGLLIFDEQIILLAKKIANLPGADAACFLQSLRNQDTRTLEELYRPMFLEGGRENGHSTEMMESVFNSLCRYGHYTTSKGHQLEYTLRAFQMAYLQSHYPKEFQLAKKRCGS